MDLYTIKSLNLLKKLSLQKSDFLRLEMHGCLIKIDQLKFECNELEKKHLYEEELAADSEYRECTIVLDAYREKQKTQLNENRKLLDEIGKTYDILCDQLKEIFSEQKSYEITIGDCKEKIMARKKQEELKFFDEISLQRWKKS